MSPSAATPVPLDLPAGHCVSYEKHVTHAYFDERDDDLDLEQQRFSRGQYGRSTRRCLLVLVLVILLTLSAVLLCSVFDIPHTFGEGLAEFGKRATGDTSGNGPFVENHRMYLCLPGMLSCAIDGNCQYTSLSFSWAY